MRIPILIFSCSLLVLRASGQTHVGINTEAPVSELDVRSVAPDDGSQIHVGNSDNSHFLRLYSGQTSAPYPALWWKPGQPFRLATAQADASDFQERMRIDAEGRLGLGTDAPVFRFDLHSLLDDDPPNMQLATPGGNHFLRFFAGRDGDPRPFLLFNNQDTFRIAHSGPNYESFTEHITLLPSGSMGLLNPHPEAKLDMQGGDWDLDNGNPGDLRIGTPPFNFRIGVATGGAGAGTVRLYSQGGDLLLGANNMHHLVIDTSGRVGIGTPERAGKLHVSAQSSIEFPQLRLTETEDDYARIKFESTAFPNSFWDIAARGGTDSTGTKRFNLYFDNGTQARNLLVVYGTGDLARNSFGNSVYDYYFTDNIYQGGLGFEGETMRLFTKPGSDGQVQLGTREQAQLLIDTSGRVGIGVATPEELLHVAGAIRSNSLAGIGVRNVVADAHGVLQVGSFAFSDADGDTRIEVEANPDEDKIRFDLAGTERWVMDSARLEPRNTGRSVFIGEGAGAHDDLTANANIAIGSAALYHNVSLTGLVAIGDSTLFNVIAGEEYEGTANTAVGYRALYATTLGASNTALGYYSLAENTTGYSNSAVGRGSLGSNTTGSHNTALGFQSLPLNNTGNANLAIGSDALFANQAGSSNCALGTGTMYYNTSGSRNVAVGTSSLNFNSSGQNNVAVGDRALYSNPDRSYLVAVGDSSLFKNGQGATLPNQAIANTGIGSKALASNTLGRDNTGLGFQSLRQNTTGDYNTGVGSKALHGNTSGAWNTALGAFALENNTGSDANTAVGYGALHDNNGGQNTALGFFALYANTTGNQNTALGGSAMLTNLSGQDNVAIGFEALVDNETGGGNVAVGSGAAANNEASDNVAVGYHALSSNTIGFQNTAIGYMANSSPSNLFNTTAIGAGSTCTANNQVRIGNSSVTSIGGYANWSNLSDGRFKRNIVEDVSGLEFIQRLRPVTYSLDLQAMESFLRHGSGDSKWSGTGGSERESIRYSGFIAQEVEAAARSVQFDFSGVDAPKQEGDMYGLRYAEFVVPLVKAVQELAAQNETLTTLIEAQQGAMEAMQAQIDQLEARMAKPENP